MSWLFDGCSSLTTIYATADFDLSVVEPVSGSTLIFYGCKNLEGGNGTKYSAIRVNQGIYTYGKIDGGTSNPGYFTLKSKD